MQITNIIAAVAFALVASAAPAEDLVQRTTPGQTAQNQCKQGQAASCCNSIIKQGSLPLVNVQLGLTCTTLNLISVLPITSQCSQQQSLACCQTSTTSQSGLVNIGGVNVCPSLIVL